MRADNTAAIIAAAQRRHELTRAKAIRALRELDHAGAARHLRGRRPRRRSLPILALCPARYPGRDRAPPPPHPARALPGDPRRATRV